MRIQLHDLVREQATICGSAPALTFKEQSLTYEQLWEMVLCVGDGLCHLGLEAGERVGVYLDKRFENVLACFGSSVAGGVFVPINPLLRPHQVAHILDDCDVSILVTTLDRFHFLSSEIDLLPSLRNVVVLDPTDAHTALPQRVSTWSSLEAGKRQSPSLNRERIDCDIAAIFYTSGSTGKPKGVVLSHRNLIAGAESVAGYLGLKDDDVILAALPLSFDAGFSQLTTGFSVGAHVSLLNYLVPDDIVRACARFGVTVLTGVPPLWRQLVDRNWPTEATEKCRIFATTGGRMPKALLQKLRLLFPYAKPLLMYGLTEAFRATYLDPEEIDQRPESIGKAIPNAEVIVVRPDGSRCDPGESGELVQRGALVALGYWNDPERTAQRFRPLPSGLGSGGSPLPEIAVWSGDIVKTDDDGFLYFVGRNDEMIKTSGYRVSPAEVEEIAYENGLVGDAVAFGIECSELGQYIVLVASPCTGSSLEPATLIAEFKLRVPPYMVPREIVIRESLPRSLNGKIDRTLVRESLKSKSD